MRILSVVVLFFFSVLTSLSQSSYHDYGKKQRTDVLMEHFADNRNGWSLYKGEDREYRIANDFYYLSYYDTTVYKAKSISIRVDMDLSEDYEIETSIRLVNNRVSRINSLQFEKKVQFEEISLNPFTEETERRKFHHVFQFGFNNTNKFAVEKWIDRYNTIIPPTYSKWIDLTRFNKLTIRRITDIYYFFINEKLVSIHQMEPLFGNRFGFLLNSGSSIIIDYLRISHIGTKVSNSPPMIQLSALFSTIDTIRTSDKKIRLSGSAIDPDGVYQVLVNDNDVHVQSDGYFGFDVPLSYGLNHIVVKASDRDGESSTRIVIVKRLSESQILDEEIRVALVIGNTSYTGQAHLGDNPVNDANDMAATLGTLGFKVIKAIDANYNQMTESIREFGREKRDADIALFFFSGHGMQVDQSNYLIPVNAHIANKQDVLFEAIPVDKIQSIMESTSPGRLNILILDACRNNPFQSWTRGGSTGLATINPPNGTLIAFSTSPGSTASNGSGRNGLYTGELIRQLQIPQRIEDVFINTRLEVEQKSNDTQSPWEYSRLRGVFYLKK
ncbi:MAG: caspase family protein [Bacteroidales bacterium]|nr:caspase family protein [Bacteroidales bacterium]